MGREKAYLRIGERTIIEEQRDTLGRIFDEIIIVANTQGYFKNIDSKVVTDIIPDSGPLGGLYSGLAVSSNIHSFLIACDMPFINLELIDYMIKQIGENDIVIPLSSKGIETLFAVYSLNCLETIRQQIEFRNLRLLDILNFFKVRYISQEEIEKFDPKEFSFFNVNSPKDYEEALKIWLKR
jgi:molybdopterin-guanine dinucleotide biosynthesis protein A